MKKSIRVSLLYSQFIFFICLPVLMEATKYLHPLVIVVTWFLISALGLFTISWIKKEKIWIPISIFHGLTFLFTIGLLILLFFRPNGQSYGNINLVPFQTIHFYLSGKVDFPIALYNLAANIGLFLPYGLYFRYVMRKATLKQTIIITICLISLIEGLQYLTKRGSLDIDDLILNVLGVCLGYLLHPLFEKVWIIKQIK